MFNTTEPSVSPGFKKRVLGATAGVLGCVGIGLVIQGPWWQINSITIAGVRDIDPQSVESVMRSYVDQRRFFIVSNRNLGLLSTSAAEKYLRGQIEERISVEKVEVKKLFPRQLHITVTERSPVAYVKDPNRILAIDKTGTIIEETAKPEPTWPVITELGTVEIGQEVFQPTVMASVIELQQELTRASIASANWILPIITCPEYEPEPVDEPNEEEGATNTNRDALNTNEAPTNDNTNIANTNVRPNPFGAACNDEALKHTRPEIHIQLENGPTLRFDRFQPLGPAVQRVRRILSQPNPPKEYIDVRFGDRVFVR